MELKWLTTNEIRKQQRCRREIVRTAMDKGDLPFEQRGRIRYARVSDIATWEEKRLRKPLEGNDGEIFALFADLL